MRKQQDEQFKVLYAKEGDTHFLYYADCRDGQEFEKAATCDYIKFKSITLDLSGESPICEFELRYGDELITRNFPAEDFLHDQNGRYAFTRKIAKLGFYRGNVSESELIHFVRRDFKRLRLDPYWTTDFRGWLTHNNKPLFVSDKIYGPYQSAPSMNPAYQPPPGASLTAFLGTVNKHVVGWPPSETALGLALGAVLLGYEQVDPLRTSAGSVSVGFSGAVGFVAPTALGKTANLEFASAVFSNVFYGTTFNTATYGDTVLPASHNANCTTNYLFGGIDKINGLFMQIDDLTGGVLNDPEHVLYQLSQGQDKGRATQTGKPARRNRFCTLFGLTNERSLITQEINGGVFSRYLELRINGFCRDAAQAEALTEAARCHPVTLGPAFVTRLIHELKTNPTLVSDLAEKYRQRLRGELDKFRLKDAQALRAQKRLAKLLCYIPASLELFNIFFASGTNPACRPIDVDGFTEWLALQISKNTKEDALNSNHLLKTERLLDFIKGNFYGTVGKRGHYSIIRDNKAYYLLSLMEDFDHAPTFNIYTDSGERIGFKKKGRIVIKAQHFSFAYESHVEKHNLRYPSNKITTSFMQYIKQLKVDGILTHESGRNTSRDFVFGHDKDGNPIKPNCYAFKVDPSAPNDWRDEDELDIPPPDFPVTNGIEQVVTIEDDDPLGGDL